MRLILASCLGLVLAAFCQPARASDPPPPVLMLSASDSDPFVTTSEPWTGSRTLYLWLFGSYDPAQGVEFAFQSSLLVEDLLPRPGITNSGTVESPSLHAEQCFDSEVIADVVVNDPAGLGGRVCFTGSQESGRNCAELCVLGWWSTYYYGFSSDGAPPCEGLDLHPDCYVPPIATSPLSWGRVRALYR